jgi:hypothetical protein
MNIDEFMNNESEKGFNVNVGNALLRILEMSTRNQRYITTILHKQLEIKQLLKGKVESDLDESFYDKVHDLEEEIWKLGQEDYHKLLENILDN